jgi:hypothetical protein
VEGRRQDRREGCDWAVCPIVLSWLMASAFDRVIASWVTDSPDVEPADYVSPPAAKGVTQRPFLTRGPVDAAQFGSM